MNKAWSFHEDGLLLLIVAFWGGMFSLFKVTEVELLFRFYLNFRQCDWHTRRVF